MTIYIPSEMNLTITVSVTLSSWSFETYTYWTSLDGTVYIKSNKLKNTVIITMPIPHELYNLVGMFWT